MLNGSHTAVAGSSLVNSATGAAGALAGWAIASLGKQLPVSEHSAISATPAQVQQPLYAQQSSSDSFQSASNLPSRSNTPSQSRVPARKMGAMQLGGASGGRASVHKPGMSTALVDELAGEFEEDGDEVANAWGSSDLMDVNADGDDWSECVVKVGVVHLIVRQRCL
jgi:SCY1-like protein 1